jgi:hypothetical protein
MVPPYLSLAEETMTVSSIDPFDYYGPALYNSYFTRLGRSPQEPEHGAAFYDFDAEAVYFVNLQGRLDAKLCLFDRSLASSQVTIICSKGSSPSSMLTTLTMTGKP